ncbi:hypothetical protein RIF29_27559 [Crotalaria pallida]|uniref:Uncharacterized protein n=1 Tax=Crotalaria pallida TaxID=3830 RepID=A0AAN9I5P8_CROPI
MVVATKPKEIALIDVPKLFHGAAAISSSTTTTTIPPPPPPRDGPGGFEAVYMFHGFDLSEFKSLIFERASRMMRELNKCVVGHWRQC